MEFNDSMTVDTCKSKVGLENLSDVANRGKHPKPPCTSPLEPILEKSVTSK